MIYKGKQIKNVTLNMLYDMFKSVGNNNVFIQTTTIEDVLSDMLQVIGDVISQLKNTDFNTDYDDDFRHAVRIQDTIACEPFTERFDNEVSGWTGNITINVDFNASACNELQ